MEKLKLVLTFAIMIILVAGGVYWISNEGEKKQAHKVAEVNKGFEFSKGIIIRMHYYKGQSIQVSYRINNVNYEYSGTWNKNPRHLRVGDSITFKYAVTNPKLIITELEDSY